MSSEELYFSKRTISQNIMKWTPSKVYGKKTKITSGLNNSCQMSCSQFKHLHTNYSVKLLEESKFRGSQTMI